MKNRDALAQIKNKPDADLKKDLGEYRERLWVLKNDLAQGKVKNVGEIKAIKKAIARIMTFMKKN